MMKNKIHILIAFAAFALAAPCAAQTQSTCTPEHIQTLTPDLAAAAAATEQIKFEPPPGYVGGVARFPRNHKEKFDEALTEIARHLRGNYVVGYCGSPASDRAKLQLEVVDPEIRKAKPALAYKRY